MPRAGQRVGVAPGSAPDVEHPHAGLQPERLDEEADLLPGPLRERVAQVGVAQVIGDRLEPVVGVGGHRLRSCHAGRRRPGAAAHDARATYHPPVAGLCSVGRLGDGRAPLRPLRGRPTMATTKRTTRTPKKPRSSARSRPATRRGPRTVRMAVGAPATAGPVDGVVPMIDERRAAGAVRILNCVPSSDQADDWDVTSAQAAGMLAARRPTGVGRPAHRLVEGRRPGQHRFVRRVGHGRLGAALAPRHDRTHRRAGQAVGPVRVDGRQGDRRVHPAPHDVHRARGHQPEGGPRRRPPLRRRARHRPALRPPQVVRRRRQGLLPVGVPAQDHGLREPGPRHDGLAQLARHAGTDPHAPRLRRHLDERPARPTASSRRTTPRRASGGHAVALVGYTADHFIVRNSWSTTWGDKGFAYASYPYATEAFTEAYGVNVA